MKSKNHQVKAALAIILAALFSAIISYALYIVIRNNGVYPTGSDTMYHVFRGDMLYKSLMNGDGYPLYNRFWYNGIQPMRYWPPLSPLLFAACQFVANGQVFEAFIYYVIVIFIGGVFAWVYIGIKRKRPFLGLLLGIIWFFLPNNLYAMFGEGNLPRSLAMVFIPVAIYSIYSYLDTDSVKDLLRMMIFYVLIIMCHLGYAGMLALAIIGYLLCQRLYFKNRRRILKVITAIAISFAITGLYLVPSLHGGIKDTQEAAQSFFQSILITLNPFYRITDSLVTFYFGLSTFIIACFGVFVSNKKAAPGFLNAIIIVFLTTTTAYSVIKIMPGSNFMWMLRFLSIALCMVFLGIIYWEKLRKWMLALFIILIVADCIPSLDWIYGNQTGLTPQNRLAKIADETYIAKAQELCQQRIAMFDLATLGAEGAYIISNFGNPKMAVYGAGWEAASTSNNIIRLNRAMSDEYFDYMFDRCKDLGADVVIIQKDQAVYGERTLVRLDAAAARNNYDILYENNDYMLYKLPVEGTFGTKTKYEAVGIGYSSYTLSLAFPNIKETADEYLDHYTFDELKDYKTVYLSGFYYEDKDVAEKLVKDLSENGVRIVILADGMPEDRETRTKSFLGVTCNVVQFENGYPILYTKDFGELDCDLFPRGYSKWITYYLNGLKDIKGTISDNNVILSFFGTGINDNVCYVGLNIPFYYYLTQDIHAEKIMQWVMGMDPGVLPEKEIYPLDVTYYPNGIFINSTEDDVNTSIAYMDNFVSSNKLGNENNLVTVKQGQTNIHFTYPYFGDGLIVSIAGIIVAIGFLLYVRFSRNRDIKAILIRKDKNGTDAEKIEEFDEEEVLEAEKALLTEVKVEEKVEEEVEEEEVEEEKVEEEKVEEKIEETTEEEKTEDVEEKVVEVDEKVVESKEPVVEQEEPAVEPEHIPAQEPVPEPEPESDQPSIEFTHEMDEWDVRVLTKESEVVDDELKSLKDFDIPRKPGDDFDIPYGKKR